MDIDSPSKRAFLYAGAIALGVGIFGPLGALLFAGLKLGIPGEAAVGAVAGAAIGYGAVRILLSTERHHRDRELETSAEAIRVYAGLPSSIRLSVKDACLTLRGDVDEIDMRRHAEQTLSFLPGLRELKNELRVGSLGTASAEEIRKHIQDNLQQVARHEGEGIRVLLSDPSRIVLEGTVHSTFESSQAEELAWNLPGVADVDNRLEIAA